MPASRRRLPRLLLGFCLALVGLGSVAALARGAAPPTPARPLVLGSLEEPGSLSALADLPHHFPGDAPQTLLFDSLIQYLPDDSVGPKLAQRWEVGAGGTVIIFHLAPNARFHDGRPVTAEDVKFTVEAAATRPPNPRTRGSRRSRRSRPSPGRRSDSPSIGPRHGSSAKGGPGGSSRSISWKARISARTPSTGSRWDRVRTGLPASPQASPSSSTPCPITTGGHPGSVVWCSRSCLTRTSC